MLLQKNWKNRSKSCKSVYYLPRRRRWRTKHETKANVPTNKTLGMLFQMPETNHTHPPPPLLQPSPISPIRWKTRPRVQRVIFMLFYSISVFSRHCAVLVRRTDKHKKRNNKQTQQDRLTKTLKKKPQTTDSLLLYFPRTPTTLHTDTKTDNTTQQRDILRFSNGYNKMIWWRLWKMREERSL
jgi:hypothetical protein